MNMIRRIVGFMFVAIGSAALFAACNGLGEVECDSDADCLSDEACVSQQCLLTCDAENPCPGDEECVDRPDGGEGQVCMSDDDGGEACTFDTDCDGDDICYNAPGASPVCTPTCGSDADCDVGFEFCDERDDSDSASQEICYELAHPGEPCDNNDDCIATAFCDESEGVCSDTEQVFYYTVLIHDVTDIEDADRCNDTTHGHDTAGAKIMDVILRDKSDGSAVSHGLTVGFERGSDSAFGNPDAILDGFPPDYEGECPDEEEVTHNDDGTTYDSEFHDDAVFAMGCGGDLWVQFPIDVSDGNWSPNVLDESFDIEVREFGTHCESPAQTGDDYYDVYLCQDGSEFVDSDETCDVLIAEAASGITLSPIEFE